MSQGKYSSLEVGSGYWGASISGPKREAERCVSKTFRNFEIESDARFDFEKKKSMFSK